MTWFTHGPAHGDARRPPPGGPAAAWRTSPGLADDDPFEDPDTPLLADDDLRRLGLWDDADDPEQAAVCGDGAPPPHLPPHDDPDDPTPRAWRPTPPPRPN